MYKSTLLALVPLIALTRAVEPDSDDVPLACTEVCRPLEDLVWSCDADVSGDDNDREEALLEAQCFCTNTSFDVAGTAALCFDCVGQNQRGATVGDHDDHDDDHNDNNDSDVLRDLEAVMRICGFSATATWASTATSMPTVSVSAERPTNTAQLSTTVDSTRTGTNTAQLSTTVDSTRAGTSTTSRPTETNSNDRVTDVDANRNADGSGAAAVSGVSLYLVGLAVAGGAFMFA